MKRGGPLARKTPLQARKPMNRTSERPARKPLSSARPKATAAERSARAVVKARAEGRCEGCGSVGPTEYAHRVGRAQGGPWCPSNALALCSRDHQWCHANPVKARALGWLLRSTDDPLTVPAVLAWRGQFLLATDGGLTPYERRAA